MKITYKDVGQGDSILLEWENDGVKKIAIIDCNKKGKANPVLEHIIKNRYSEIELIVLSHPHRDHFSGLFQLFNYTEKKGIIIKNFAHTLHWSATNYWKYFEVSSSDTRLLSKTISKWGDLKKKKLITRFHGLQDNVSLPIDEDLSLSFLSPCHGDAEEFQRIVENDADGNIKEASQAANHLSTVILLSKSDLNILFTSDAEVLNLQNILSQYPKLFEKRLFQLCQLPHHGSVKNHFHNFWQIVKTDHIQGRHAIASAGKHRTYNHPSFEVLEYFHNNGYTIHCTNILNGMKEYTAYLEEITNSSLILEGGSSLAEEYRTSCDRVFTIQDNKINLL
jgi:beta-lactamase superfamily II metal-dependent hydrolase